MAILEAIFSSLGELPKGDTLFPMFLYGYGGFEYDDGYSTDQGISEGLPYNSTIL